MLDRSETNGNRKESKKENARRRVERTREVVEKTSGSEIAMLDIARGTQTALGRRAGMTKRNLGIAKGIKLGTGFINGLKVGHREKPFMAVSG